MMPEEVVQAAVDLKAKALLPVHWSKFALAHHDWDEPITRVIKECEKIDMPVYHPMIGDILKLKELKACDRWWTSLR